MLSLGTPNAFSAIACYRHPKPVSARHEVTRSSRRYDDLAHALDEQLGLQPYARDAGQT